MLCRVITISLGILKESREPASQWTIQPIVVVWFYEIRDIAQISCYIFNAQLNSPGSYDNFVLKLIIAPNLNMTQCNK